MRLPFFFWAFWRAAAAPPMNLEEETTEAAAAEGRAFSFCDEYGLTIILVLDGKALKSLLPSSVDEQVVNCRDEGVLLRLLERSRSTRGGCSCGAMVRMLK